MIMNKASVEKNSREIKEYIEEIYWGSGKRVLLLGHSKGGVDAAAALSLYWSDLKDKVAGLALAQSPYGGSPIASDILREGQIGDYVNIRKLMEILICKLIKVWWYVIHFFSLTQFTYGVLFPFSVLCGFALSLPLTLKENFFFLTSFLHRLDETG